MMSLLYELMKTIQRMIRKQYGALHVHITYIQLVYSNSNKGQFHTMAPDGLAAARAVDMLRSRTGLIPAHAAQLLLLASIEAALALYFDSCVRFLVQRI